MQSFRLPQPLKDALDAKAKAEERPVSEVLVSLVRRYVSTPPRPPKPPAKPADP
jgi:hypothetical protein